MTFSASARLAGWRCMFYSSTSLLQGRRRKRNVLLRLAGLSSRDDAPKRSSIFSVVNLIADDAPLRGAQILVDELFDLAWLQPGRDWRRVVLAARTVDEMTECKERSIVCPLVELAKKTAGQEANNEDDVPCLVRKGALEDVHASLCCSLSPDNGLDPRRVRLVQTEIAGQQPDSPDRCFEIVDARYQPSLFASCKLE